MLLEEANAFNDLTIYPLFKMSGSGSGARTHGSLTNDDEVNAAAWAAGRGAVVGASKVSCVELVIAPASSAKQKKNI